MVTRRCSERRRFLRPDTFVAPVFGYLLAVAGRIFGIEVHCVVVMSNHYHAVVTDWSGRLPMYLTWLHRLVAVALNVYRGRWEAFWSSSKPSVVRLESAEDTLDKMVYVISNPVAAGLVSTAALWPGLVTAPKEIGEEREREFARPMRYFSRIGRLPSHSRLRFTKPPGFEHISRAEFAGLLEERLAERERGVQASMATAGRSFAGVSNVKSAPWSQAPGTPARRRNLSPHLAARNPKTRAEATTRLNDFRREYREAWTCLARGRKDVTFPAGTYQLRRLLGVRCHPPPAGVCWSRGED